MTTLTFYGGVNEIGGNKILLEDKDTRIFLDFGKSFTRRKMYFEEFLNPRVANGIEDFLRMGLLPDIEGAYRDDLMAMSKKKIVPPNIDAVLLSHAHADHADYISFLHRRIPIYMGKTCHLILQAIEERSGSTLEREVLRYKERPIKSGSKTVERKIITFRTGDKFKIGSLDVEPIHVDHSIPGAYGFIIYTSEGTVVYTGDIRLHGTNPQMTIDFIDKAKSVKPIVLIAEGTRIADEERDESEAKVSTECKQIVSGTNRLVFVDFNFKDVDRLRTFYNIAKETDRKLVVKLSDAYFLKYLSKDPNLNIPKVNDDNIVIYVPKKKSGKYSNSDYSEKESQFVDLRNAWTAHEIAEKENKALCSIGFYSFTALIDMKPTQGAVYIHSASELVNEEQQFDQKRIDNWLEHFGMTKFQSHCSGHARGRDLIEAVREIGAKTLYPIHTEHPDAYVGTVPKITIVKEGVKYKI